MGSNGASGSQIGLQMSWESKFEAKSTTFGAAQILKQVHSYCSSSSLFFSTANRSPHQHHSAFVLSARTHASIIPPPTSSSSPAPVILHSPDPNPPASSQQQQPLLPAIHVSSLPTGVPIPRRPHLVPPFFPLPPFPKVPVSAPSSSPATLIFFHLQAPCSASTELIRSIFPIADHSPNPYLHLLLRQAPTALQPPSAATIFPTSGDPPRTTAASFRPLPHAHCSSSFSVVSAPTSSFQPFLHFRFPVRLQSSSPDHHTPHTAIITSGRFHALIHSVPAPLLLHHFTVPFNRRNQQQASPSLLTLVSLGFFLVTYNLVTVVIHNQRGGSSRELIEKRVARGTMKSDEDEIKSEQNRKEIERKLKGKEWTAEIKRKSYEEVRIGHANETES